MKPALFSVGLLGLALATTSLAPAAARANSVDYSFCTDSSQKCRTLTFVNGSAATLTQVNYTQEITDGKCEQVKKTLNRNLWTGDSAKVEVYANCKYKVKAVTTKGCAGQKQTHLNPPTGDDWTFRLQGGCGTLSYSKNLTTSE